MSNNKRKIYRAISIIVTLIIVFIASISLEINGNKIIKNTYINGIDIGGLNKEQAKTELEKKYKVEDLKVTYSNQKWDIDSKEIDFSYDLDKTINTAYSINRKKSNIENIVKTVKSKLGEKIDLQVDYNYNEQKLIKYIENLSKEIDVNMKDAFITVEGTSIQVNDSETGLSVNVEESIKNILKEIKMGNQSIQLVVTKIEPNIKKDQLKEVDTLLGSHSTKFDSSVKGRSANIRLATDSTSNVLLMPGDTFSYNEHTGTRTVSNGYKNAPVIVQGVVQEGIGGGVCQVSSTLYNSVLYAGLELVNIKNHSIPSTYVPKGRDATVTDSGIDFVFKNNLKYPVYIKNYVSGNTVTCQIYGSSKDKQKIEISTSTDGVSVAPVKKVNDPTLPKGKEKQLEAGRNGYTVSTYRTYIDSNGNVIKKEKVATSYYPKKQGIIAVGTMEVKPEKPEVIPPVAPPTKPPVKPEIPTVPETPTVKPEEPPVEGGSGDENTSS